MDIAAISNLDMTKAAILNDRHDDVGLSQAMMTAFELLSAEQYDEAHRLLLQDRIPDNHQESLLDEFRLLVVDYADNWDGFVESDGEDQARHNYQIILRCVGILEYLLL